MAHQAQLNFCKQVKAKFPNHFDHKRVFEVGSRNVNGSIRSLFKQCTYIGIDAVHGQDVDQVCLGHEYIGDDSSFDVVCSVETFEHDPYAAATVANMIRLLKPGGLFFMTCAGVGRAEHGTANTGDMYGPDPTFYRNVQPPEFIDWLQLSINEFDTIHIERKRKPADLYFFGVKAKHATE